MHVDGAYARRDGKMYPEPGGAFVTTHRRPILTVVEDTSPGAHDSLIAACDRYRYELLGVKGHHDNYSDNPRRWRSWSPGYVMMARVS